MLAKVIVWGETRAVAMARAEQALRNFHILGIRTNIAFLLSILRHPRFIRGEIDTSFVDDAGDEIRHAIQSNGPGPAALAAAAVHMETAIVAKTSSDAIDPFTSLAGWRG
jgi:acetyl/propionyl-CoA carboxylase alpha subunit